VPWGSGRSAYPYPARIGDTTVPTPPRKRAPLRAVPDVEEAPPERSARAKRTNPDARPNGKGADSPVKKWEAAGRPVGKNRQHNEAMAVHNHGPDLPPGKAVAWLPSADEVPPKPTTEPAMEWPGLGHMRDGHPEWQLRTIFVSDDKHALKTAFEAGEDIVVRREWQVRWVPPDERRCNARAVGKISEWMGNRCTMKAIKGGRVCQAHGGRLSTVRKAAQATLARAALPAAEKLVHIALNKRGVSDADRIKAIVQILDRAGVEGRQTIELEVKPWQAVLERVYSDVSGVPIDAEEVEGVDYEVDDEESEHLESEGDE
jgi:hypothetical protein